MTPQMDRYRAGLLSLWQSAVKNGLAEGEFPGFGEIPAKPLETEEASLCEVAQACRPEREMILARGGEWIRFLAVSSPGLDREGARQEMPFAPLAVDAEGNCIGLSREAASGEIYLTFREGRETASFKERGGKETAFFFLTGRFENLPGTVRSEIESGLLLTLTATRLLDPGRCDPRFPPLDVSLEIRNRTYLLFLIPALVEFVETLSVRKSGAAAPVHLLSVFLLLVAFVYGGTFRRPRLRLAPGCFLFGGLALHAAHAAALWLRGGMGNL